MVVVLLLKPNNLTLGETDGVKCSLILTLDVSTMTLRTKEKLNT